MRTVSDLETLTTYFKAVLGRAHHHAHQIEAIPLALIGAVLAFKDEEPIEVRSYNGAMANVLWFSVAGSRYAILYNHLEGVIELRHRSARGEVLASFTDDTSVREVLRIFTRLRAMAQVA